MHTAIILDGNGRWAEQRGLPRPAGHVEGARAVRRAAEAAPELGIRELTLYAFSSDNWKRPEGEVQALLRLLCGYLDAETPRCVRDGVRVSVVGRRDRLPGGLRGQILHSEIATAGGERLHLRLAIDYSARAAIREDELLPDVDLLIRTAGEQRLSDFLLWECAYAELYFTQTLWPDYTGEDLRDAVGEFHTRQRRFGGVRGAEPAPSARPAKTAGLYT